MTTPTTEPPIGDARPFDLAKYRSIGVISAGTRKANRKDAKLGDDMAAYKRLRKEGLQPARIEGSYALERDAGHAIEFEMGRTFGPENQVHVREGVELSEQAGLRGPFDK